MEEAIVNAEWQVEIPAQVRKALGLKQGDKIEFAFNKAMGR